ncbi:unnamed protein product [Linum trigynum]|uniref:Uncharacterized protein n=1 Tax=Linum trigynum TaxID=586398 RepID=A0AAV2GJQ7_9ROSI
MSRENREAGAEAFLDEDEKLDCFVGFLKTWKNETSSYHVLRRCCTVSSNNDDNGKRLLSWTVPGCLSRTWDEILLSHLLCDRNPMILILPDVDIMRIKMGNGG